MKKIECKWDQAGVRCLEDVCVCVCVWEGVRLCLQAIYMHEFFLWMHMGAQEVLYHSDHL